MSRSRKDIALQPETLRKRLRCAATIPVALCTVHLPAGVRIDAEPLAEGESV